MRAILATLAVALAAACAPAASRSDAALTVRPAPEAGPRCVVDNPQAVARTDALCVSAGEFTRLGRFLQTTVQAPRVYRAGDTIRMRETRTGREMLWTVVGVRPGAGSRAWYDVRQLR